MTEFNASNISELGSASNLPNVKINFDEAKKYNSAISIDKKQKKERKYNVKILRQDYELIKIASEKEGRSASYFVSFLLYDHIFREMMNMSNSSEDALLLIAEAADSAVDYDISTTPWLYDFMLDFMKAVVAKVTKDDEASFNLFIEEIEKYSNDNSHLYEIVKIMLGMRHGS